MRITTTGLVGESKMEVNKIVLFVLLLGLCTAFAQRQSWEDDKGVNGQKCDDSGKCNNDDEEKENNTQCDKFGRCWNNNEGKRENDRNCDKDGKCDDDGKKDNKERECDKNDNCDNGDKKENCDEDGKCNDDDEKVNKDQNCDKDGKCDNNDKDNKNNNEKDNKNNNDKDNKNNNDKDNKNNNENDNKNNNEKDNKNNNDNDNKNNNDNDTKNKNCDKDGKCDASDKCDGQECDSENDEDSEYYYEPCDHSDDIDCVRHFFATYSKCSIVYHSDNKPVYREKQIDYFPNNNLTVILNYAKITGLDGNIEKFYINKKTGNLVMAVQFDGIILRIKKAIFLASRRGKEPAVAADYANGTYPVTLTAVIPMDEGISLKESRVTSYLPDAFPKFFIGPKVANSKDPAIQKSVASLFANIPTAEQEFFLTEGPNLFFIYLQKYICDFNIPISL